MMARKTGRCRRWTSSTIATTASGRRREARSMALGPYNDKKTCHPTRCSLQCGYSPTVPVLLALLFLVGLAAPAAAEMMVRIEGKRFIAPDGDTLQIRGISLGNWLMPEGYMFKFEVAKSPRQIYGAFDRLLGRERAAAFWEQFRDTYITREDIRFIKAVGFNTVRI